MFVSISLLYCEASLMNVNIEKNKNKKKKKSVN